MASALILNTVQCSRVSKAVLLCIEKYLNGMGSISCIRHH